MLHLSSDVLPLCFRAVPVLQRDVLHRMLVHFVISKSSFEERIALFLENFRHQKNIRLHNRDRLASRSGRHVTTNPHYSQAVLTQAHGRQSIEYAGDKTSNLSATHSTHPAPPSYR